MMRGRILFLVAIIALQGNNIRAQEDLAWISSIEEFKFSSPTDSVPVKKEENFHLEGDTSTNIHFTYYWDDQSNDWINESKSIGNYDRDANRLEMQNFTWDGSNTWTGTIRYFFWYNENEEIPISSD